MNAEEHCKENGLIYKGDFILNMSDDDRQAGYIKFNIPDEDRLDSLDGEGVWGWIDRDSRELYKDDSYTGMITAILCNDPLNYFGILIAGVEVELRCHGSSRPTLDPDWVQRNIHMEGR